MIRLLMILVLMPAASLADDAMSVEQFRAYAEGKTLYFAQKGAPYGIEQYQKDQHSVWQYSDGTCAKAVWHSRKNLICFVYEGTSEEICWSFFMNGDQVSARALGADPADDLIVIWRDDRPIMCKAPGVGT